MAVTNGPIAATMYMGLSSDTKPVVGVEFACQFYEWDTGRMFIWTGSNVNSPAAGQWVEYFAPAPAPQ